ncbi:MAG: spore maturation protein [Deltaproteobacteria bacterium]|nr:spore maturation protein [Deltaproteobacteria bacterium]
MANNKSTGRDNAEEIASTTDNKASAISIVFVFFVVGGIFFGAFSGKMQQITEESFNAAKSAVTLAINLIGVMALWLGFIRILEAGGLMFWIARKVKPLMTKLFPEVPAEHPAMSAMILNLSANLLGLGNAATPMGIRAMEELNKLNPFPGMATNAMCLFLAINTSSVTILPLGVIGVRAAAGSKYPAEIFLPTLIATIASTTIAVIAATLLARRDKKYLELTQQAITTPQGGSKVSSNEVDIDASKAENFGNFKHLLGSSKASNRLIASGMLLMLCIALVVRAFKAPNILDFLSNEVMPFWLMPFLMLGIICFGIARGVRIYEAITEGAKQGFDIAVRIIPFLVVILVAIGMFRASGAMEVMAVRLEPLTGLIGMPADTLPMALVRPLSGSAAFGIMSALIEADPNSYSAYVASTMQGSTETTFYVLAVYFGAVGITKIRYALVAALLADVAGLVTSSLVCSAMWRH